MVGGNEENRLSPPVDGVVFPSKEPAASAVPLTG